MIEIRPGSAADAADPSAAVRRDSWHAACAEIIAAQVIERATAAGGAAAAPPPYRRTLVAEAGDDRAVVGYASFGPERSVLSASPSPPAAAATARCGDPPSRMLTSLLAGSYQRAVLWVLADNARARRFYKRAGFAPDDGANILTGLRGVLEVRYLPRDVSASYPVQGATRAVQGQAKVRSRHMSRRVGTPVEPFRSRWTRAIWPTHRKPRTPAVPIQMDRW